MKSFVLIPYNDSYSINILLPNNLTKIVVISLEKKEEHLTYRI